MNELAQKWVEALRSGRFKQGRELLYNESTNAYCCLGVACVVAKENGIDVHFDPVREQFFDDKGTKTNSFLPYSVLNALDIEDGDGSYGKDDSLSEDNDSRRCSFAEIADIIESEPEGLFNA